MKSVTLKKSRDYSILHRHPWVFSGAIEASNEDIKSGDTVEVLDSKGSRLGFGSYSRSSQIRVRMLSFGAEAKVPDENFIVSRVAEAVGRRASFFGDGETNAVRLINAESDGLPGVVADYYAGFVVCQFTSAGAEKWKQAIATALMTFAPFCLGVSERLDIDARTREGLPTEPTFTVLSGAEPPELIEIVEGPCKFLVDVRKGHKTGFYLDQRDARRVVGPFANGREVLNCFSYTGGFGLYARVAGATNVTQLDVSKDALDLAKRNEELMHICGTKMHYEAQDVFSFLRTCRDQGRQFDMIILDPPKFAHSKSQVMKASRGYKDINLLAMKLLRPDGILASFSCSGAIDMPLFEKILASAADDSGHAFQVVAMTGQPVDHPVDLSFPEGRYLKGLVLRRVS